MVNLIKVKTFDISMTERNVRELITGKNKTRKYKKKV